MPHTLISLLFCLAWVALGSSALAKNASVAPAVPKIYIDPENFTEFVGGGRSKEHSGYERALLEQLRKSPYHTLKLDEADYFWIHKPVS